jgi:hypothetical protein
MTTPASTTFRIDPLHPSRLLCEACGAAVCELPPGDGPDLAEGLTVPQAAIRWREQGAAIQLHAVLCEQRRASPRAEVPVCVQVKARETD